MSKKENNTRFILVRLSPTYVHFELILLISLLYEDYNYKPLKSINKMIEFRLAKMKKIPLLVAIGLLFIGVDSKISAS